MRWDCSARHCTLPRQKSTSDCPECAGRPYEGFMQFDISSAHMCCHLNSQSLVKKDICSGSAERSGRVQIRELPGGGGGGGRGGGHRLQLCSCRAANPREANDIQGRAEHLSEHPRRTGVGWIISEEIGALPVCDACIICKHACMQCWTIRYVAYTLQSMMSTQTDRVSLQATPARASC